MTAAMTDPADAAEYWWDWVDAATWRPGDDETEEEPAS
jgi:hypothetical protein